jgi:hypothetical protein
VEWEAWQGALEQDQQFLERDSQISSNVYFAKGEKNRI